MILKEKIDLFASWVETESKNEIIFKAQKDLKSKYFIQTSPSLWELALVPKFWENLAAESTVRLCREGEVDFDNSVQQWTINDHSVHTRKFSSLLIKSNQFVLSAHPFGRICIILFPLCLTTTFSKNSSLLFQFANLWIFKKDVSLLVY